MKDNCIYIFLDEGGNFDFTEKGTKYFSLTCTLLKRPFDICNALKSYKYDCIEYGIDIEHFHCCEDNKYIRNKVFDIISEYADAISIYTLVVKKSFITRDDTQEAKNFYTITLGSLLDHVIKDLSNTEDIKKIIIITDQIPIASKRKAVEKAIKEYWPKLKDSRYHILHHSSKSHIDLQIADYCNWAIFRRHEKGDATYYAKIHKAMKKYFFMGQVDYNKVHFKINEYTENQNGKEQEVVS